MYKYNKKLAVAGFYARLASFEIEVIEQFRSTTCQAAETQRRFLAKLADDANVEEQVEDLVGEIQIGEEVHSLADELAIVALYRIVEMNTKLILKPYCEPKEVRECYKIDFLRKLLTDRFTLNLDEINGFKAVDELRCINNGIKHSRDEIADLGKAWDRLVPHILGYLKGLAMAMYDNAAGLGSGKPRKGETGKGGQARFSV